MFKFMCLCVCPGTLNQVGEFLGKNTKLNQLIQLPYAIAKPSIFLPLQRSKSINKPN